MPTIRGNPPDWVKDAVFYQIFPDRFARGTGAPILPHIEPWDSPPTITGFKGGNLAGITEHLDYLTDLGVNALYLNPIFASAANHRYHTYDYYSVDPLLGGNAAFRILLNEAHRRNLRVVLDGVFNHCGRGLYQFHHVLENGLASPFAEWFNIREFPLNAYDETAPPSYAAWWGLRGLPKFNTNNQDVRGFLWNVAEHWVREGIDGWRIDVPEEINDRQFWQEFRQRVKLANPEAFLIGEIWRIAPEWVEGDRFDSVMNYPFTRACLGAFAGKEVDTALVAGTGLGQVPHLRPEDTGEFFRNLHLLYTRENRESMLNLLSSHDIPRFLTLAGGDESALRMAVLFQMTYPGAPCVYYGDEIGMEGGRDPDCRRAFTWDEGRWNPRLREHYKAAIALRKAHPALRRGDFAWLSHQDDALAFARMSPGETLIVAFNLSQEARITSVPVRTVLDSTPVVRDLWSGRALRVVGGVIADLHLPPRSGTVLIAESANRL